MIWNTSTYIDNGRLGASPQTPRVAILRAAIVGSGGTRHPPCHAAFLLEAINLNLRGVGFDADVALLAREEVERY